MLTSSAPGADLANLAQEWDETMKRLQPARERQLTQLLELAAELVPHPAVVADLGTGPGTVLRELGARFPDAAVVGVDLDPVLVALAGAIGADVVEADLRATAWVDALPAPADLVVSAYALHYLSAADLDVAARVVAGALSPRGWVLLLDRVRLDDQHVDSLVHRRDVLRRCREHGGPSAGWDRRWARCRRLVPDESLWRARELRLATLCPGAGPTRSDLLAALRGAGLAAEVVAQELDSHVVVARRAS